MAATTASLAYIICRALRICCRAFCLAALDSSDRRILDRDNREALVPPTVVSPGRAVAAAADGPLLNVEQLLPLLSLFNSFPQTRCVPSGSLDAANSTGSCAFVTWLSCVVQQMEWELPQATRDTFTPSRPCTSAGFLFTMVVPLPC